MELSLLDRRLINELTFCDTDWIDLIKKCDNHETYDILEIPKFENELEDYFKNNKPNIILLEINEIINLCRIIDFKVYRDGGTVEFITNIGVFCIDNRIGSSTKSELYNNYPLKDNSNILKDYDSLKNVLIRCLKNYKSDFYQKTIDYIIKEHEQ